MRSKIPISRVALRRLTHAADLSEQAVPGSALGTGDNAAFVSTASASQRLRDVDGSASMYSKR
jgi:hypothetical protein